MSKNTSPNRRWGAPIDTSDYGLVNSFAIHFGWYLGKALRYLKKLEGDES